MNYEIKTKTDNSGRSLIEGRNFRITIGHGVLRAVARTGGYTITVAPTSKTKKVLTEAFANILNTLDPVIEVLKRSIK